jgi:hypothetical protein
MFLGEASPALQSSAYRGHPRWFSLTSLYVLFLRLLIAQKGVLDGNPVKMMHEQAGSEDLVLSYGNTA